MYTLFVSGNLNRVRYVTESYKSYIDIVDFLKSINVRYVIKITLCKRKIYTVDVYGCKKKIFLIMSKSFERRNDE